MQGRMMEGECARQDNGGGVWKAGQWRDKQLFHNFTLTFSSNPLSGRSFFSKGKTHVL